MAPGIGDDSGAAIGRVVTSPTSRGADWVTASLAQAVRECEARWPAHSIWLGAQAHLQGFTASMVSWPKEGYLEDDIPAWGCEGSLPDIVRRQERAGPSPVVHRMVFATPVAMWSSARVRYRRADLPAGLSVGTPPRSGRCGIRRAGVVQGVTRVVRVNPSSLQASVT